MPEGEVNTNVKAINATIMLLSQKIGYLVRNEKILSQNILVLNEKIKKLEDKLNNVSEINKSTQNFEELDTIKAQITELYNKISGIRQEIDEVVNKVDNSKSDFITRKEFQEIKYLVDVINPLEYVTYKQIKELLKKD